MLVFLLCRSSIMANYNRNKLNETVIICSSQPRSTSRPTCRSLFSVFRLSGASSMLILHYGCVVYWNFCWIRVTIKWKKKYRNNFNTSPHPTKTDICRSHITDELCFHFRPKNFQCEGHHHLNNDKTPIKWYIRACRGYCYLCLLLSLFSVTI